MSLPDYLQQASKAYRLDKLKSRIDPVMTSPDPVEWIEREFFIPETNAPIVLVPYQAQVIRAALERDAAGDFYYSTVLYSDLKKSAKSTIAAAVALYLAWHSPYETVRIVANDLKQANSRTFYYIERAIHLNPRLRSVCKVKMYHIELPNQTTITAIPVDPKGEAGGGDLITCFTELWAMKNTASQQLWAETTMSPLKFGRSMRWCESYAGYEGESPILEQLYERGVKDGERIDDDLELYRNERLLVFWNTVPRCDWQTDAYYANEARDLTPQEFDRIHRNQWGSSTDAFVPPEWWDFKCLKPDIPPLGEYQQLVIACDAGVSSDCFGIVGVSKHGDACALRYARAWIPPKGGKLDFSEGEDSPEAALKTLIATGRVAVIAYDPYQLHDLMQRIKREQGVWTDAFEQGASRLMADKGLYDMIREGRVQHDGTYHDLTAHIHNANRKAEGEKLRIVKRKDEWKIDLAVSLSMAAATAMRLNV